MAAVHPATEGSAGSSGVLDVESGSSLLESTTTGKFRVDLNDTLPLFFSKGFPVVDVFLVASFSMKIMPHNKLSGSWAAIVYLTSFLLSFCLHMVGMSGSRCIQPGVVLRATMACVSTALRMLSAAALLLFLDFGVHSVAVLPPFLLAVALVATLSWRALGTGLRRRTVGYNWADLEKELKLGFDLSANVVSMAFAGLSGRVLGGDGGEGRAGGFMAVAPECFLFYSLVLGLLMVLHCTVPSYFKFEITRHRVAKVYKPLVAYLALLLLILASVVAAEDLLRINVLFVLFGVIAASFAYFIWRKYQRHYRAGGEKENAAAAARVAGEERDADLLQPYVLECYFGPLFSLVMVTQSKYYSIIDDNGAAPGTLLLQSWMFKCFLSLGLCSILIYAVRIVVFAEIMQADGDRTREDRCAISCATYATYGAMAITGVCFVLVFVLKFDELKNIIASD